ncbi:MAG TPA: hypothetical protein VM677_21100 [Actinokineospora sp.]|nr:hypothetical protein [Actinokineospora sp.]
MRAQLYPVSSQRPTQIGHSRGHSFGGSRGRHSITESPPPAETSAAVDDLTSPGPDLVAVACRLADELGQAFGVPEMGQLTTDGTIRRKHWNHGFQTVITAWAAANNITVTDDTMEQ